MDPFKIALLAVKKAGHILLRYYNKAITIRTKNGNWQELVTNADLAANKAIVAILKKTNYAIFSEEGEKTEADYTWYIDPLDGTTNYITHIPFWCTAVGLVKEQKPILGIVYNPLINELFTAQFGKGAKLNGKSIHVSKNSDLKKTVINYCHPNLPKEIKKMAKLYLKLKLESRDLRRFGSAGLDLSYLAAGRYDVLIHTNTTLAPWDFVAGYVIASEAGAKITDWLGRPWTIKSKNMLATNSLLHQKMLKILKRGA
jgi:myo-inositol-1(or 4)-monophosphatase